MTTLRHVRWSAALMAAVLSLGCAGADGKPGPAGLQGPEGDAGVVPPLVNDVSGTVTDGTSPLKDVAVSVAPGTATATTDASGSFSMPGVPLGAYAMTFHLDGYVDQTVEIAVNLSGPTKVSAVLVKGPTTAPSPPAVSVSDQLKAGFGAAVTLAANATGTGTLTYAWKQIGGPAVVLSGADTATASFTTKDFKTAMGPEVLANARFGALGVNPDEAGNYVFEVSVTDASGQVAKATVHVDATRPTSGLRMVPIGVPVWLQGDGPLMSATQTTWSWTLDTTNAAGSAAALSDASSQFPSFTPDVMGTYTITETVSKKTLQIYAGTWMGEMTTMAQNTCTLCHNDTIAPDVFTPWKGTKHHAILQTAMDGHADASFGVDRMLMCTLGYDPTAANGGFDDVASTAGWTMPTSLKAGNYDALLATPKLGQLAGVQCESCHGPQGADSHGPHANSTNLDLASRISWSSDVCASCHQDKPYDDKPAEWALGKHSDLTLALSFGTVEKRPNGGAAHCGRCHSAQGYSRYVDQLARGWMGNLTSDGKPLDTSATPTNHLANDTELASFGLTQAGVESQTCAACHDPHDATNPSQLRVYDKVAALPNGLTNVSGMGAGMICATCHNSRNGEHTDFASATANTNGIPTGAPTLTSFSGPHAASQADAVFGFNAYFVNRLNPSPHLAVADTCVGCHSGAKAGSANHSFAIDNKVCASCHSANVDGVALQATYKMELDLARSLLASKLIAPIAATINAAPGAALAVRAYDPKTGLYSSASAANVNITSVPTQIDYTPIGASVYGPAAVAGLTLHLPTGFQWVDTAGNTVGDAQASTSTVTVALTSIKFAASVANAPVLYKAYWNLVLLNNDNTFGVHNPGFYNSVFAATNTQLKALP